MSTFETLLIERQGAVALLTLNRPDSLNAFDTKMRREFVLAARGLNEDDSVRVVVLTGSGRAFCAGADLAESPEDGLGDGQTTEDMLNSEYKPGLLAVHNAPKPWISAVNGACAGIGSAYAMTCDLMVMAENAYIYQAFSAIGLVPDGGATWHLQRILGPKRAYEMIATGEKVKAEKCLQLGLCNRLSSATELVPSALSWARELAAKSPLALRHSKASLNFAAEASLADVISNEARLQHLCVDSDDAREGVLAFLEKRAPDWKGC